MAAQSPNQDVSSDDQTHLGATQTQIFMSYYTHPLDMFITCPEPVQQDPNFGFGHHLSFSQNDELGPRAGKKKKVHTVVLSPIRTHC
jgi:hypothetical protein